MPKGVYERKSVEERFWKYVNKNGRDNDEIGKCWEWTGGCSGGRGGGYGWIGSGGKMIRSHRFSYQINHPLTKSIDDIKLCVLHACDNPKCVNPTHLRLGTHQDNMTDMKDKGRRLIITRKNWAHLPPHSPS